METADSNDKHFDTIKNDTTETDIYIEKKGCDAIKMKNFCNYALISNNQNTLTKRDDDRRIIYFRLDDRYSKQDCPADEYKQYFDSLRASMIDMKVNDGETITENFLDNFYNYFMKYKIDENQYLQHDVDEYYRQARIVQKTEQGEPLHNENMLL